MMREADKLDKASAKRSAAAADSLTLSSPATVHDASTWSPSFLIDHLKKQVREIIQDEGSGLGSTDLNNLLSRCDATLHRRLDLTPVVFKCIQQLALDLIFVLCKKLTHLFFLTISYFERVAKLNFNVLYFQNKTHTFQQ